MPIDHVICSLLESTTMEFSLLYSELVQIGVGSNKKKSIRVSSDLEFWYVLGRKQEYIYVQFV